MFELGEDRTLLKRVMGLLGIWLVTKRGSLDSNQRPEVHSERKFTPKAATVEVDSSPILGLSSYQYLKLVQYFGAANSVTQSQESSAANMAGKKATSQH